MKIIFDTNFLFANQLLKGSLPRPILGFLQMCQQKGHEIVIPLTTLYEFNCKQNYFVNSEVNEIKKAVTKLADYRIQVGVVVPENLVKPPNLISLIETIGVACRVEQPIQSDFEIAHRKACLKESPHDSSKQDKKSDEMRDLVIWVVSLRVARENGGAILLSQDLLLRHHSGDKEAFECRLIRCKDFERAYEALDLETPSARIIRTLILKVWNNIIASALPLEEGAQLLSIKHPKFMNKEDGSTSINAEIMCSTGTGGELNSLLRMEYKNEKPFLMDFSQIKINGQSEVAPIRLELEKPLPSNAAIEERLSSLKHLIGE